MAMMRTSEDNHDEAKALLLTSEHETTTSKRPPSQHFLGRILHHRKDLILWLLVASNLLFATALFLTQHIPLTHHSDAPSPVEPPPGFGPSNIARVPRLPTRPEQFHWYTDYSSENETVANGLWDAIDTAYGFIAVKHEWAAENGWMRSMPVPGEEEKGLYLLEGYHQFHCLKIVRKILLESTSGQPLSYPVQHARHCFDYFRQFIQCHADNTPLYTLGRHTSGDGQFHMCHDWSQLRKYAAANSACFRDRVGQESLREQFGHCRDREDDGLPG